MKEVYKLDNSVPVKLWSDVFEQGALEQINNSASLPFAFHHVALMPDGHQGFGAPIGGILATRGVVVPNFVGVDIGCGMVALETDLNINDVSIEMLKEILAVARYTIPTGFTKRKSPIEWASGQNKAIIESIPPLSFLYENSKYQIGTLGGGNHFIELQVDDSTGHVWFMIHSGSRNMGKQVCEYYNNNNIAKEFNTTYYSSVPASYDLAFLPVDSHAGKNYLSAMKVCLDFAYHNREFMMTTLFEIVRSCVNVDMDAICQINAHHNYVAIENHFGENVYVHRKGAIQAREGQLGIIPGSMGTPSYIVKGLGNKESFMSASHGAGRHMSRKQANKQITKEMADNSMKDVLHGGWKGSYDESPLAYKSIEDVMDNQKDLVTPIVKLRPILSMKG